MGQVLYGLQLFRSKGNESDYQYDVIGKNSEAFTAGDPVTVDSSHGLKVAGTNDSIVGVAAKTVTMASNNETVAKVMPGYTPISVDDVYLMGTNGDMATNNLTAPGTYYELIAASTGAMQIDQASAGAQTSAANRVFEIVEVDPNSVGGSGSGSGLRQVLVRVVKTPYTNVSITS